MPLYEYECDACGQRFEVIQKFSDAPIEACTKCGRGPVRKLLSSPAIQFKGSGWYITDYAQKGKSDSTDSGGAAKAEKADKTDKTDKAGSAASTSESTSKSDTSSSTTAPAASSSTPTKS